MNAIKIYRSDDYDEYYIEKCNGCCTETVFFNNGGDDDDLGVCDLLLTLIYRIIDHEDIEDNRNVAVLEGLGKALTAEIDKEGKLDELMEEVEKSTNELDQFKAFFKVLGYEED